MSGLMVFTGMMNNIPNGSAGMAPDTPMAQSNSYSTDGWTNLSPYSHSPYNNSPMNEYGNWNGYMPHSLPSESLQRMPPPQPQPQPPTHQMIQPAPAPQQTPMAHHQLPMLNTTTAWPSQLTNPTPSGGSYSAPPLSMTPVSNAAPVEAPRPPAPPPNTRRTLTIEQKRAMCQYNEENPGTRQADIGAKFGVERSTVSKVLRHRDQFLKRDPEPEPVTGGKRGKAKHPDFDRTLSNYVRRQQQGGFEVKDEEIMEHAKLFARGSGNQDSILNSLTGSWLQKFKQKHGIGSGGRLVRRASETNIPDSARMSTATASLKRENTSGVVSPVSPTDQMSPLSEGRSDEEAAPDGLQDFDFTYRQTASHSTTSLASEYHDARNSSFSASTMSPTGVFTFSPDPNVGGFAVDQSLQLRSAGASAVADMHHRERRSNTFPSLNVESIHQASNTEPITPRHASSSTAPSSALESPVHDMQVTPFAINTALTSPPTLRRTSSASSITGRASVAPNAGGIATSGSLDSSPVSPSQDDARRAANTLLNYIQSMNSHGQFDQKEYMTIVQLTKKLQVHQHQPSRPSIGGLSRIPEGDTEMPAVTEVAMETS